jgi:acetolactate synthase-1/3 small subunit
VGETEDPKVSRMTIVVRGDDYILEQIKKQLNKLIDVIKIVELNTQQSVFRELAMIKVNTTMETRAAVIEIVSIFRANIVDVSNETLTVEMTGDESKIEAFINLMDKYGIVEIVRTGLTAIERGSKQIKDQRKFEED